LGVDSIGSVTSDQVGPGETPVGVRRKALGGPRSALECNKRLDSQFLRSRPLLDPPKRLPSCSHGRFPRSDPVLRNLSRMDRRPLGIGVLFGRVGSRSLPGKAQRRMSISREFVEFGDERGFEFCPNSMKRTQSGLAQKRLQVVDTHYRQFHTPQHATEVRLLT